MTESVIAARSWRPALVVAPVFGFLCGGFLTANAIVATAGAFLAFGLLVAMGGASTLVVDEGGLTLARLGRTRRIEWTEATEVVCWVRQSWGGGTCQAA